MAEETKAVEEKRGPGRPPKPQTIACVVKRDFWDENGERHCAGTVVHVSIEEALDGVESGAFGRYRG